MEIAPRRHPFPALASPARLLFERDQPVAFPRGAVDNEVGVGRAGPLDDTGAAQKSDPAARSVSALSGAIRR